MNLAELWQQCAAYEKCGKPYVLVTLVSVRGQAPQAPGAKILVDAEGLRAGTVGGGKLETAALKRAAEILASREKLPPETVAWNLQRDLGMSCGGEVTMLFEARGISPWRIVVFGAGHVAQALSRVLLPIDCQMTWIDSRADWLGQLPEHPRLEKVLLERPEDYVSRLQGHEFVLTMTQGHAVDFPILSAALKAFPNLPYVGAIGSPVKALKLKGELMADGVPAAVVDRLICPIGGWSGKGETEEIAVCTAAELIRIRDHA